PRFSGIPGDLHGGGPLLFVRSLERLHARRQAYAPRAKAAPRALVDPEEAGPHAAQARFQSDYWRPRPQRAQRALGELTAVCREPEHVYCLVAPILTAVARLSRLF